MGREEDGTADHCYVSFENFNNVEDSTCPDVLQEPQLPVTSPCQWEKSCEYSGYCLIRHIATGSYVKTVRGQYLNDAENVIEYATMLSTNCFKSNGDPWEDCLFKFKSNGDIESRIYSFNSGGKLQNFVRMDDLFTPKDEDYVLVEGLASNQVIYYDTINGVKLTVFVYEGTSNSGSEEVHTV